MIFCRGGSPSLPEGGDTTPPLPSPNGGRRHPKLLAASLYHFGGWKNTLSAIGVNYQAVRKLERWSKERVKERIRTLKQKGKDLSWKAMFRQGYDVVVSMANYYYGSWQGAITRTGFNYREIKKKPGPISGWKEKPMQTSLIQRLDKVVCPPPVFENP
ncbi:MAG: hypothetical protein V2A65_01990 [Candidatus Omnitrophota bacterium]